MGTKKQENLWENSYFEDVYSGCFRWIGSKDRTGYGKWRNRKLAHREAWERVNGSIPAGLCVCHSCDNPECINPEHLFLGTHGQNMRDASQKKRMHLGEKTGNARLTQENVSEIRNSPFSLRKLAEIYDVTHGTINAVRQGKTWGWLS
jgi:hypothetical protein